MPFSSEPIAPLRKLVACWLPRRQHGSASRMLIAEEGPKDRLSIARRHVAEGERHVASQRLTIARFDHRGHHVLAAQGRVLLRLLEQSLRLARQDLERESSTRVR
jgi:hypothetical protein